MRRTPFANICLLVAFLFNSVITVPIVQAQELVLPKPGVMVHLSPPLHPAMLKGMKVNPNNPFRFEFILDQGDSVETTLPAGRQAADALKDESSRLIKYFLASLTIPEKDLWVNLSPYEKDRIVPDSFGLTEMGRDLLAQDYMLKQVTASLIYPEDEVGKKFWRRVYEEASKKYGNTNIPVNTFNKVWIVPEKAVVYENAKAGTAYVVESKLKVMLEADYLSLEKNTVGVGLPDPMRKGGVTPPVQEANQIGSQIVREIVIPELTKEINEGANFAQLRQVYSSLILATWYKKKIKDSILSKVFVDKSKIVGVGLPDPMAKGGETPPVRNEINVEQIYQQYLTAFKKGVYNYIKEDIDEVTQERTARKYFSGGFGANDFAMSVFKTTSEIQEGALNGQLAQVSVDLGMSSIKSEDDEQSPIDSQMSPDTRPPGLEAVSANLETAAIAESWSRYFSQRVWSAFEFWNSPIKDWVEEEIEQRSITHQVYPIAIIGGSPLAEAKDLRARFPDINKYPIVIIDPANIKPGDEDAVAGLTHLKAGAESFDWPKNLPKAGAVIGIRALEYSPSIGESLTHLRTIAADDTFFAFVMNHPLSAKIVELKMDLMAGLGYAQLLEQASDLLSKPKGSDTFEGLVRAYLETIKNAFKGAVEKDRVGFAQLYPKLEARNWDKAEKLVNRYKEIRKIPAKLRQGKIDSLRLQAVRLKKTYADLVLRYGPVLQLRSVYGLEVAPTDAGMEQFLQHWGLALSDNQAVLNVVDMIKAAGFNCILQSHNQSPNPIEKYMVLAFQVSDEAMTSEIKNLIGQANDLRPILRDVLFPNSGSYAKSSLLEVFRNLKLKVRSAYRDEFKPYLYLLLGNLYWAYVDTRLSRAQEDDLKDLISEFELFISTEILKGEDISAVRKKAYLSALYTEASGYGDYQRTNDLKIDVTLPTLIKAEEQLIAEGISKEEVATEYIRAYVSLYKKLDKRVVAPFMKDVLKKRIEGLIGLTHAETRIKKAVDEAVYKVQQESKALARGISLPPKVLSLFDDVDIRPDALELVDVTEEQIVEAAHQQGLKVDLNYLEGHRFNLEGMLGYYEQMIRELLAEYGDNDKVRFIVLGRDMEYFGDAMKVVFGETKWKDRVTIVPISSRIKEELPSSSSQAVDFVGQFINYQAVEKGEEEYVVLDTAFKGSTIAWINEVTRTALHLPTLKESDPKDGQPIKGKLLVSEKQWYPVFHVEQQDALIPARSFITPLGPTSDINLALARVSQLLPRFHLHTDELKIKSINGKQVKYPVSSAGQMSGYPWLSAKANAPDQPIPMSLGAVVSAEDGSKSQITDWSLGFDPVGATILQAKIVNHFHAKAQDILDDTQLAFDINDKRIFVFSSATGISGSTPGQMKSFYETNRDIVEPIYAKASKIMGDEFPVSRLLLADLAKDGRNLVVLVVAHALYVYSQYQVLMSKSKGRAAPEVLTGNSIGLLTSMVISGAITLDDLLGFFNEGLKMMQTKAATTDFGVLEVKNQTVESIKPVLVRGEVEAISYYEDKLYLVVKGDATHLQHKKSEIATKLGVSEENIRAEYPPAVKGVHHSFYGAEFEGFVMSLIDRQSFIFKDAQIPLIDSTVPDTPLITRSDEIKAAFKRVVFNPVYWGAVNRLVNMSAKNQLLISSDAQTVNRLEGYIVHNSQTSDSAMLGYDEFILQMRKAGYGEDIDKAVDALVQKMRSKRIVPLGDGYEGIVYPIEGVNFVIKILNVRRTGQKLRKIKDAFPEQNFGQMVARKGNVLILKRQDGHNLFNLLNEANVSREEALNAYQKIADFPQEAYDRMADQIKIVNDRGYQWDAHCSNLLFTADHKFNLVDVDVDPVKRGGVFTDMFESMVDALSNDQLADHRFRVLAKIVFEKIYAATLGRGFRITPIEDPHYERVMLLANIGQIKDYPLLSSQKINDDKAMSSKGGIDFNANKLNLITDSDAGAIDFKLDPQKLKQLQNAPGFYPVIVNIQPMTNIRAFLGLDSTLPQSQKVLT